MLISGDLLYTAVQKIVPKGEMDIYKDIFINTVCTTLSMEIFEKFEAVVVSFSFPFLS